MPPKRQFFAKRKTEIAFDADSRREFLQGFSERKKQRRAFGLAMQKVKDRKAKLEKRAERKEAMREQMEQAEKQKAEILESMVSNDLPRAAPVVETVDNIKTYQDKETKSCWGGEVIVTTSTKIPGDSSDDDDDDDGDDQRKDRKPMKKGKDEAQEFAGNVERFMQELKGNMPGKKKKRKEQTVIKAKGKHGAAKMKGMGGTADLKAAQRILKQAQTKKGKGRRGGR